MQSSSNRGLHDRDVSRMPDLLVVFRGVLRHKCLSLALFVRTSGVTLRLEHRKVAYSQTISRVLLIVYMRYAPVLAHGSALQIFARSFCCCSDRV